MMISNYVVQWLVTWLNTTYPSYDMASYIDIYILYRFAHFTIKMFINVYRYVLKEEAIDIELLIVFSPNPTLCLPKKPPLNRTQVFEES